MDQLGGHIFRALIVAAMHQTWSRGLALGFKYAEGFQRVVLVGEQERPTEAAALETQSEE